MANTNNSEKLSALMDGELVDKAFLQDLTNDVEMQNTWRNYHLIGDVMRGDVSETLSDKHWNIAERVAFALDDEPIYHGVDSVQKDQTVAPLQDSQPLPQQARRHLPKWFTQLGQVGIAASVSLAVIFGVQQYGTGNEQSVAQSGDQLPVLQTVPFAGSAEPVSLTRDNVGNHTQQAKIQDQRRRINAMLQDYELQLRLNSDTNR